MARRRDDEYDDAYEDEPERRRRRREYDEDEDDDRPRRRRPERAGLDGMFLDTNMVVLVLFGLCCGLIAVVLSIVELGTGKDPEAKSRATTVLIISAVMTVIAVIVQIVRLSTMRQL
jgi:hypothetical protein